MRISDWSSDVCSSDLCGIRFARLAKQQQHNRSLSALRREFEAFGARQLPGAAIKVAIGRPGEQFALVKEDMKLGEKPNLGEADAADEVVRAEAEIGRASCRERVCQYV